MENKMVKTTEEIAEWLDDNEPDKWCMDRAKSEEAKKNIKEIEDKLWISVEDVERELTKLIFKIKK